MTKVRDPLSVEEAVQKIAKVLTWEGAALVVGKSERLIGYWSDADDDREPTISQALKLDAAYREKTKTDAAPIMAAYAYQLDLLFAPIGNRAELRRLTAAVAKEAGEAISALVEAGDVAADRTTCDKAVRELDEVAEVITHARAALKPGLRAVS